MPSSEGLLGTLGDKCVGPLPYILGEGVATSPLCLSMRRGDGADLS
jgi:hypothetical protein